MKKFSVIIALAICASSVEARVGSEAQTEYENDAVLAGYCNNTEHLKWVEAIYKSCLATESQWDSLYEIFELGRQQPKLCAMDFKDIEPYFARRREFKEFMSDMSDMGCE